MADKDDETPDAGWTGEVAPTASAPAAPTASAPAASAAKPNRVRRALRHERRDSDDPGDGATDDETD